jgi:hypothetical protein
VMVWESNGYGVCGADLCLPLQHNLLLPQHVTTV